MKFVPCAGREKCRELGERCLGCGRSLEEIARVRRTSDELTALVLAADYENPEAFIDYLAAKAKKKVKAAAG